MFSKKTEELLKVSGELCDIASAEGLLSWDQETYMPPKGAGVRAFQLATLAGIYHEKLTKIDKKLFDADLNNIYDRALVREMRREYEKATKLPRKLVEELSTAVSRGFDAWQRAKKVSDFKVFQKQLENILELETKAAKLMAKPGQDVYDVMLDNHEQDLTQDEVEKVFGGALGKLKELGSRLSKLTTGADDMFKNRKFPITEQENMGREALKMMGFDFEAGRQDRSAHPFTTNFGVHDVRITTWENRNDPRPMLYATIHEGGHALYEQGVDPKLERTHLAGGQGLVLHESQSRLWENMVGRSPEFLRLISREEWTRAVNVVRPSLVRVEADEVTYGLHIMIRFEIEKDLVAGKIKVAELPGVWNKKYKDYLGIQPNNDAEGVLQDVHWSHGSFGYFPTYLLGSMTSAQIWRVIPDKSDLKSLREWLKENIHQYGKLYTGKEMVKLATGESLNPKYYIEYLENKFKKLYNTANED